MIARLIILLLPFLFFSCDNLVSEDEQILVLGDQIDRAGRAGINNLLNKTFSDDNSRIDSQNIYNSTDNANAIAFENEISSQLAIYDAFFDEAVDGNACGDNPLTNRASFDPSDGLAIGADRYKVFAGVLVDDQIYINTNSQGAEFGTCSQYFAVELTALGETGFDTDCGGLTPVYDNIETTYSLISTGVRSGVDDGVTSDDVTHSATNFPFLAAPK